MQVLRNKKIRIRMIPAGGHTRQERMHPDDFEALRAWVNAKRSSHIS